MNKKLFNILLFTAGAAIGSLVTWKVVKTRYEQLIQEEIDSFKETYALCMGNPADRHVPDEDDEWTEEENEAYDDADDDSSIMTDYAALASKYARSSSNNTDNLEEGGGDEEVPYIDGPYVIEPGDFGNGNYDHACHCITYYADCILADDWGVKLDIDDTIGADSINHFGDYAEDVVHVRNKRLNADYEVVRDPRNYTDVMLNDPLTHAYAD